MLRTVHICLLCVLFRQRRFTNWAIYLDCMLCFIGPTVNNFLVFPLSFTFCMLVYYVYNEPTVNNFLVFPLSFNFCMLVYYVYIYTHINIYIYVLNFVMFDMCLLFKLEEINYILSIYLTTHC